MGEPEGDNVYCLGPSLCSATYDATTPGYKGLVHWSIDPLVPGGPRFKNGESTCDDWTSGGEPTPWGFPTIVPGSVPGVYKIKAEAVGWPDLCDGARLIIPEVLIEKCDSLFFPKGGVEPDRTTTIRAFIAPSVLVGKFKFTLQDVSHEPGYCVNAPATIPSSGPDSDSWKDLQFPTQTGFTIAGVDNEEATTTTTDLPEAIVKVESFDYGAYGKIKVEFTSQDGTIVCNGREQGGVAQFTRIPLDVDANNIADGWTHNSGGSGDDADVSLNNTINGDGLTRYQEYRGVDVDCDGLINAAEERLDPTRKNLFVRGDGYLAPDTFAVGGAFAEANINVHIVSASFCDRDTDVLVATHEPTDTYEGQDGHIMWSGVRTWRMPIRGSCWPAGGPGIYGNPCTFKTALDRLFSDKPYVDNNSNNKLDWDTSIEDTNDNGVLDANENDGPSGDAPVDDADGILDGDHVIKIETSFDWGQQLSPFDIDKDGKIECPQMWIGTPSEDNEYSRFMLLRHTITHEMGHAVGILGGSTYDPFHCDDPTCLMAKVVNDFKRDGHFCNGCRAKIMIHNSNWEE